MADRRPQQAPLAEPHYRKLRPDTRTSFDQLILAEAGVLIDSPSYHRDEQETRPGSSVPQKARPMGEKVCFGLRAEKLSTRRSRDEGSEACSSRTAARNDDDLTNGEDLHFQSGRGFRYPQVTQGKVSVQESRVVPRNKTPDS